MWTILPLSSNKANGPDRIENRHPLKGIADNDGRQKPLVDDLSDHAQRNAAGGQAAAAASTTIGPSWLALRADRGVADPGSPLLELPRWRHRGCMARI